ncbi:8-oxo-dGTP pyrophosphatase MutT (NUDIX family) [Rhodoligotrophos appendicifer]|uniref:NUDIX hydrolase n=1 Tax=Rhodoligotrophos appendicifer TaxID=987056 RepID=UPI0014795E5F|nr:NUDIX hydrolase [Rhodoligotrophos appendicifer]
MSTRKVSGTPDPSSSHLEGRFKGNRSLRPKDAATLIVLRNDGGERKIMMGKRHEAHKFMPNKFVFPGGRLDPADCRVPTVHGLHPAVEDRLMVKMRGRPTRSRARGLAMAAVREAFEETGLVIGKPADKHHRTSDKAWQAFFSTGYAPDLSGLRYFARAITPPGRTRRFDARFFVVDASYVANIETPHVVNTEELLDRYWFTFEEAHALDLPWITNEVLKMLGQALGETGHIDPARGVPFQRMSGSNWVFETL